MKTRFRYVTICAAVLLGVGACSSSSNNNDGGASGGRGGSGGIHGTGGLGGAGGRAGSGGGGGSTATGGTGGGGGGRANGGNGGNATATGGAGGGGGNRANGGAGGAATGGAGGNRANGGNGGNAGSGTGPGGAGGGGGAVATLTDQQAAGVAMTANQGEIQQAQLAQGKSNNPDVLAFAMMMVTDHTAAVTRLQGVLDAQNLTPADSPQRMMLTNMATQTYNQLFGLSGSAFDTTYAMSQVTAHTMVLNLFDSTLIPSATNAALKTELQTERTAVMMHLSMAQTLVSKLAGDGGTHADAGTDH